MNCQYCNNKCIKKGIRKSVQKFYCKSCNKYQQLYYQNKRCNEITDKLIIKLNNEGVGISSISRIIHISKASVIRSIKRIGTIIIESEMVEEKQEYEVDEMHTYIKNKNSSCWIMYSLNKKTKKIISLVIGNRIKENLKRITERLNTLNPLKIYTDKLPVYRNLINDKIHEVKKYKTNHIERFNLTLRTHLKRLN